MNINGEPTRNDKTLNGETSLGDSTADDLIISGDLTVGGTSSFDGQLDMNNAKIINLGTPTNSADATNKSYVDGVIPVVTGFLKIDGTNSMSADLNVGSNQVKNVSNGTASTDAVNLSQLTTVITDVNTNTAAIALNTAKVGITPTQAAEITANTAKVGITPTQAAEITANTAKVGITPTQASKITDNETAIDSLVTVTNTQTTNIAANTTAVAGCLKLDGTNAMTADLDAGTKKIINVGAPIADTDAATKEYVDDNAGSSPWSIAAANIYRVGGKVGIGGGTSDRPTSLLDIQGDATLPILDKLRVSGDMTNTGVTDGFNAYTNGAVSSWNKIKDMGETFDNYYSFRQSNDDNTDGSIAYTQLKIGQYLRSTAYTLAQRQSAVWEINVSNENGSFASWQNEGSILLLMKDAGSVVINSQTAGHQNNNYRLRVYGGAAGSSGWVTYSDDRIKYNEQNITGALATLNKLKAQKYEKIIESLDYRGKWIPSNENWDSVKNSYDSSGRRLFDYVEEIGFIAQDVRKIPDLSFCVKGEEVDEEGDETPLMMNYNDIFALSIQGIQELDTKRKEDAKRILDLNKRLLVLEEKLKNVETNTSKEYIL